MKLSKKQSLLLKVQQASCFLFLPVLFPMIIFWMKYIQKYRINNIKKIRGDFKRLVRERKAGLLVCPNHLTYIDSMLLMWAFGSPLFYLRNFKSMCWNLPKSAHVKESILYRVICYLGKCIPISTQLSESKLAMKKATSLLQEGHYMMVFPEGTRSKTGRINTETFIYGVGQMHIDSKFNDLLCVYIRGAHQRLASKMPIKSERFDINMQLVSPVSESRGRRAMRDVAGQIINHLVSMEKSKFKLCEIDVG